MQRKTYIYIFVSKTRVAFALKCEGIIDIDNKSFLFIDLRLPAGNVLLWHMCVLPENARNKHPYNAQLRCTCPNLFRIMTVALLRYAICYNYVGSKDRFKDFPFCVFSCFHVVHNPYLFVEQELYQVLSGTDNITLREYLGQYM